MNEFIDTKKWNQWFDLHEKKDLPLYLSVDIRDAGFKVAVVDTNLFPAGFNNLCATYLEEASSIFRSAIHSKIGKCRDVIIVAENHTRNIWYLENLYWLSYLVRFAGYLVRIVAPFSCDQDEDASLSRSRLFITASGKSLCIESLDWFVSQFNSGNVLGDVILMNNDLIGGIPKGLIDLSLPVYPSPMAGWHKRRKSMHFFHMNRMIREFAETCCVDPWLFSCLYESCSAIDIHSLEGREKLSFEAEKVLTNLRLKYKEYGIKRTPFFFLKADYGSYGMGVYAMDNPKDILSLNRKLRNKMHKGKNSLVINQFIIQEGIPSALTVKGQTGEVCLYQIMNQFIGAFYRVHQHKNEQENLNAPGMSFFQICSDKVCSKCPDETEELKQNRNLSLYKYLGRLAGIAAVEEFKDLSGDRVER